MMPNNKKNNLDAYREYLLAQNFELIIKSRYVIGRTR